MEPPTKLPPFVMKLLVIVREKLEAFIVTITDAIIWIWLYTSKNEIENDHGCLHFVFFF